MPRPQRCAKEPSLSTTVRSTRAISRVATGSLEGTSSRRHGQREFDARLCRSAHSGPDRRSHRVLRHCTEVNAHILERPAVVLLSADAALYQAKREGRNRVKVA